MRPGDARFRSRAPAPVPFWDEKPEIAKILTMEKRCTLKPALPIRGKVIVQPANQVLARRHDAPGVRSNGGIHLAVHPRLK